MNKSLIAFAVAGAMVAPLVVQANPATVYTKHCVSCHKIDGTGNPDIKSPSLVGQSSDYLRAKLDGYPLGEGGTMKALMVPQVNMHLPTDDDRQAMAVYLSNTFQ